ncbi:hypothetical protein [Paraburkholderia steynii]|uniref:hypothetical protein n=1 Tax=Paraburkholderia steynii TaxID=1245441 RepID=UPI00116004E6|nr:hypothetical protein [Paraburkholderia steynii]
MNPRRVHSLFEKHFPKIDLVMCEWIHLFRDGTVDRELLGKILSTIESDCLLIHIRRTIGDFLQSEQALDYIVENVGKSQIRIADRAFNRFVMIASNGVAATWPQCLTRFQIAQLPDKSSGID